MLDRVVHPVVDVKRRRIRIAHARAVHVGLVGQDHRRADRAHRLAVALFMIADGPHDHRALDGIHPQPLEDDVGQIRPGVFVVHAADQVADVMYVRGDGGQLRLPFLVPQPLQGIVGDARGEIRVTRAVLGVPDGTGVLVGLVDVRGDFSVALHVLECDQLRAGDTRSHFSHGFVHSCRGTAFPRSRAPPRAREASVGGPITSAVVSSRGERVPAVSCSAGN